MEPTLSPRLLPWSSPEGKPCYLVTDQAGGHLSRLADDLETAQLATGIDVLGLARAVLDDPVSPYTEVRYAGLRLAELPGRRPARRRVPGPASLRLVEDS
ncbi:hypothetical protein [Streptomyces sp. NPDC048419]|uniref:hypothetical protein n=1 Tax=Streptomyces sp. NPDC048419 TaxID=3365547 RepID=UPI0037191DD0